MNAAILIAAAVGLTLFVLGLFGLSLVPFAVAAALMIARA